MLDRSLKITRATLLSIEESENLLIEEELKYHWWWWLRSPGRFSICAASVSYVGVVRCNGSYVDYDNICVRPALQISNLKSSDLQIGDTFEVGDYNFRVISENLAWMYEQDIGSHRFDEKTNVYEQSEIKQFVDDWFEREIKPLLPKELDFSKVKFEETVDGVSYFIAPREWVKDYALSDVFATISLEGNIVRISPTMQTKDEYIDYDWRDFPLTTKEIKELKKLISYFF